MKILLNAEVLVEFQIQRSVSILFQHKDTVPDCSHATYVGPWLQLYFICLRLLQGEFTAQCPPDSLGQLVTKYETQELSLGSGLGAAVVPCTRTQDGRGGRRLIPSPTAIRRLTTFTHREAAFLRCILTFANAFSPKKSNQKASFVHKKLPPLSSFAGSAAARPEPLTQLKSLPPGLAARASSLLGLTRLLRQSQVVWIPEEHPSESGV